MKTLDLPKINFNTDGDIELAKGKLLELYKELGWDGECELNPINIKVCKKDWKDMCEKLQSNAKDKDERLQLAIFWMNFGPSVDDNIKEGKVKIYNGTFIAPKEVALCQC